MALILGHSQVKYFDNYLHNGRITTLSFSGCRVEDLLRQPWVEETIPYMEVVAVHCGINNIPSDNAAELTRRFLNIYEDIKKLNPKANVIFSSILPRDTNMYGGSLSMSRLKDINNCAKKVNEHLKEKSEHVDDLFFVSHTEDGENNRRLLSKDGLHLSYVGTATIVNTLESTIETLLLPAEIIESIEPMQTVREMCGPLQYSDVVKLQTCDPTVILDRSRSHPGKKANTHGRPASTPKAKQPYHPASTRKARTPHFHSTPSTQKARTPHLPATTSTRKTKPHSRPTSNRISRPNVSLTGNMFSVLRIEEPTSCNVTYNIEIEVCDIIKTQKDKTDTGTCIRVIELDNKYVLSCDVTENSEKGWAGSEVLREEGGSRCGSGATYEGREQAQEGECGEGEGVLTREIRPNLPTYSNTQLQSGGGGEDVVFCSRPDKITIKEATELLLQCERGEICDKISGTMPSKPRGGELYLIDTDTLPNKDDFRVDSYLWVNGGLKKYPNINPHIYKTMYKVKLKDKLCCDTFQKHIMQLIDDKRYVIVHYIGDETVYEPLSHGNSKSGKTFVRTCPSVIDEIKSKSDDLTTSANLLFRESRDKAKVGNDFGVKTARNVQQVKNHLYKIRREKKLSNDEIYNLLELSYQLDDFNKQIDIFPSLVCISGLKELFAEFNELLRMESSTPLKLYYDTTYNLGELFVSVLSFQHILFENSPTIPVAFMLHEKRDAKFHERFFRILAQHIPNLAKSKCPIICDREPGIRSAIETVLPNTPLVHCWLHIKRDIRLWLHKLKATQDDISVYCSHLDQLLRCDSEIDFNDKLLELEQLWSNEFRIYFTKHIKLAIVNYCGKWIIEPLGIYNYYSGVTTNPAESVNNVLKSIQKRKQQPIDMIVLTMYFLQKSQYTEIQCGRAGIGKFTLKGEFSYAKLLPEEIILPDSNISGNPEEILNYVKRQLENYTSQIETVSSDTESHPQYHEDQHESVANPPQSNARDDNETNEQEHLDIGNILSDKNATLLDDKSESERKGSEKNVTQQMLAEQVIRENKIHWVASMNAYIVEGIKGTKRVLTIKPKEECSCPSTGTCYHILAVKLAFSLNGGQDRKQIKNLSLLRKNSKPRVAKKTGQKKPKKADFEVIAAPDSILKSTPGNINEMTPTTNIKLESGDYVNTQPGSILKRKSSSLKKSAKKKIRFDDNELIDLSAISEEPPSDEVSRCLRITGNAKRTRF